MDKDIIKRLIKVRNIFGESVYSFSRKLKIPQPTLQRYETYERKAANKLLISLAQICNVNINWLLTGEGEIFVNNKNTLERCCDNTVKDKLSQAGKRLVIIQEKHNFLDREMAKLLEISEKDYLKLVTGQLDFDIYILNNIKKNFIVDVDWLLYGNNTIIKESGNII